MTCRGAIAAVACGAAIATLSCTCPSAGFDAASETGTLAAGWPCISTPPMRAESHVTGGFSTICIGTARPPTEGAMPVPCHIPTGCPNVAVSTQFSSVPTGRLTLDSLPAGSIEAIRSAPHFDATVCSVLHCNAVFCNVLHCYAVVGSVPHCNVPVSCVLHCDATVCSVPQCKAAV